MIYLRQSTQKHSIDKSIRTDVNFMRYEYKTGNADDVIWIPEKVHSADQKTKTDSLLTYAMVTTMAGVQICIDLSTSETQLNDQSPG